MATVQIWRWDDTNFVPKLLDNTDTALITALDSSGSNDLRIGTATASNIVLGNTNGSAGVIVSSSMTHLSAVFYADNTKTFYGASLLASQQYNAALGKMVFSASSATAFVFTGSILSASVGLKVTGTSDVPGGTNFALDGVFVTSSLFTAPNLSRIFGGPNSNVSDLHTHSGSAFAATASLMTGGLIQDTIVSYLFPVSASAVSGGQAVFLRDINGVAPTNATSVSASRLLGIVSGASTNVYTAGQLAPVFTVYGEVLSGFTNLTGGMVYYLSNSAGLFNTSPPNGLGYSVVQVGIAKNTTQMILQPEYIVRGLG